MRQFTGPKLRLSCNGSTLFIDAALAIGRISNAATGDPVGTGFLMSGADLLLGLGKRAIFLDQFARY